MSDALLRHPSERVSPRARLRWLLGAVGNGVFWVVAVSLLAQWRDEIPGWAVVPVAVLVAVHAAVVPQWRYLVHRWEVTETAVYTQTGWWTRERRVAPMSRIQTVDHHEAALDRLFGLATVTVTTASAAGSLSIAGLDAGVARRLVADLTRKADAVEGDAT